MNKKLIHASRVTISSLRLPNHLQAIIVITEGGDLIHQIPIQQIPSNPDVNHQNPTNPDVIPINNIYRDVPTEWMMMKNPKQTLGKIIRDFNARTTKAVHDAGYFHFRWQSKYYDRIIRNEKELNNVRN
ncbi:MAG: hypothetical protein NTX44_03715 [Ignavibacteriales bacterium]|nr:hypothetical protein [Ignavibacteriales bacterium]